MTKLQEILNRVYEKDILVLDITNEMAEISKETREKYGIFGLRRMRVGPDPKHPDRPHMHIETSDDKAMSLKIKDYQEGDNLETYIGDVNNLDRKQRENIKLFIHDTKDKLVGAYYGKKLVLEHFTSVTTLNKDSISKNYSNNKEFQEDILDNYQEHVVLDGIIVESNGIIFTKWCVEDTSLLFLTKTLHDYTRITVVKVGDGGVFVLLNDLGLQQEWFEKNRHNLIKLGKISKDNLEILGSIYKTKPSRPPLL